MWVGFCFIFSFYMYLHMKKRGMSQYEVCVCRSEDNLQDSLLSFYHVCPKGQTHVIRLGSKRFYLPSHPTVLNLGFIINHVPNICHGSSNCSVPTFVLSISFCISCLICTTKL